MNDLRAIMLSKLSDAQSLYILKLLSIDRLCPRSITLMQQRERETGHKLQI
jgi:hypothetical protein